MRHKKIKEEIVDLAPRLASFKDYVNPVQMPEGFIDKMYSQVETQQYQINKIKHPKTRHINAFIYSGIAASVLVLAMYLHFGHPQDDSLSIELVANYVESNVDEYAEFISEEANYGEGWITQEFENIPETQLISYLENNLDQIDLENFIVND